MNDQPPYPHLEDQDWAPPAHHSAIVVGRILERLISPTSILELGCGDGTWLHVLADSGNREVIGVEEAGFAFRHSLNDTSRILTASLARPLDLKRTFDLVICLDGSDCVEPAFADTLVNTCVQHAEVVLFGTAPFGSVPESAPWLEMFSRRGFTAFDLIRPLVRFDPRIPVSLRNNLLIFARSDSPLADSLRTESERIARIVPPDPPGMQWDDVFRVYSGPVGGDPEAMAERIGWESREVDRAVAGQYAAQEAARALADQVDELQQQITTLSYDRHVAVEHAHGLAAHVETLRRDIAALQSELERTQSTVAVLRQERAVIVNSTLWRMAEPLREFGRSLPAPIRVRVRQVLQGCFHISLLLTRLRARVRRPQRVTVAFPVAAATDDGPHIGGQGNGGGLRIAIISGEAHTPGHAYRVVRLAEAAAATGAVVTWLRIEDWDHHRDTLGRAQVVWIWRVPYSPAAASVMQIAREAGAKVIYDLDDLMIKPDLARIEIIDGIRSQGFSPEETARLFARVQKLALMADLCTCTTNELADHVREYQKTACVLPNGFDEAAHAKSRMAVRAQQATTRDGLIRIGYASGSRTHQRDFAQLAGAVARVLGETPSCRLVLFRDPNSLEPVVNPGEFTALVPFADQIEWRDMVPLSELPSEIARFDINLVPLEIGNPFCEAKSELKYFEAALVDVCTVASRTGPMGRAIRDGITGRLVDSGDGWYDALRELVADSGLRQRIGHAAYHDVLWRFGPQRREQLVLSITKQLWGGPDAARAFQLELRRDVTSVPEIDIPTSDVVFSRDLGGQAQVTVVIPLYNYAQYVTEALESVRRQTMAVLDLVVVDDCSTDTSLTVALDWARKHADRFNRILVLRNRQNSGLARSRNAGFNAAETGFVLPLDADNRLLPDCCVRTLAVIGESRAAFAYPRIQCFGDADHIIGEEAFSPMRFCGGNYIDAMALIGKWAWAAVGGYAHIQYGWEDYDFWCRCVEHEFWGVQVPEVLAEYRVHSKSMLQTSTDQHENKLKLIRDLNSRHGWLSVPYRA